MSVRVMTAVWELSLPDSEKIVLLALADCANDEGHCWPSMASLSRKCSKGERTVQGAIKALCEAGHLTRREVPGKGCNYTVHPRSNDAPAKSAPPQPTAETPAAAADKPSRTITKKQTREHEILEDWSPQPFGERSKSRAIVDSWSPDELETQLEHFRAHHKSHGSRFIDWQDAWSTWVLNSRRFGPSKIAPKSSGKPALAAMPLAEQIELKRTQAKLYQRMGRDNEADAILAEISQLERQAA